MIIELQGASGRGKTPVPFWHRVVEDHDSGCWLWTGAKTSTGYGQVRIGMRMHYVHRVAYEWIHGHIEPSLVIDHLCRNHACVNPGHLDAVSTRENILRGTGNAAKNASKTHCPHGHPLSGHNLRIAKNGQRYCFTCKMAKLAKYKKEVGRDPGTP